MKREIDCSYSGIAEIIGNGTEEEALTLCQDLYSEYESYMLEVAELEEKLKAAKFNALAHKQGLFYAHKKKKCHEKPLVFPQNRTPNAPFVIVSVDTKEVTNIDKIEPTLF